MKRSVLTEMNSEELGVKLQEDLEALQNLRFQKSLQQLENPVQIKYLRREIAQIKTAIKEYSNGIREIKGAQ
ncbi:MAG: 50S ribosomal protein L29 [Candidatus Marinimicrobia bacterium]|nr:50S ribosomal protein L29 [Candidatus Neomarinimicrobiota bacterium]MCH7763008.1 50S ribosomal protein L29 [Candidatus Neomarinimicrobiota bacterium]